MTIDALIETDLGETPKRITIDGAIRGSSGKDSNFADLFQPYTLGSQRIYGSKAVVVNLNAFAEYVAGKYGLSSDACAKIQEQYSASLKDLQKDGYCRCFWDDTSKVHHRDLMRHIFIEFAKSAERYKCELDKAPAETEEELVTRVSEIVSLEKLTHDIKESVRQLYSVKVGGKGELFDLSYKMLQYSQGYQLSSIRVDAGDNLWKSKITKIELDSGITKDQQNYSVQISPRETHSNIDVFLGSIESSEVAANKIELPTTHRIERDKLYAQSVSCHKKGESFFPTLVHKKQLVVKYRDAA